MRWTIVAMLLWVGACGSGSGAEDEPDAGETPARDPFEAQPDTSEGLTNVSADLEAVLENGALDGACDRWEASPNDRRLRLLCGKYLFFYGAFDQVGAPAVLFTTLIDNFPELVGPGFEQQGLVLDPYSADDLPVGFGYGADAGPGIPTVSFTCASCHFGKLPDGRYAVGAPNHAYDYGEQMLLLMSFFAIVGGDAEANHHPDAVAAIRPFLDRVDADPALRTAILTDLFTLAGLSSNAPALTTEDEGQYASWKTGVMDAVTAPLYFDDDYHITTKIHSLWGMPTEQEAHEWGAEHMMIGWAGASPNLQSFFSGFLQLGDAPLDQWPPERMAPLEEYVHSLRAPGNPTPPTAADVARGEDVFFAACIDCHGGPRGMGKRVYTVDEVGTDPAIQHMMDADLDGEFCCDFEPGEGEAPTHGVKSPRLVGLWAMNRFLHNGSIDSLDALLCLEPRAGITEEPHADVGHEFGCDLPEAERRALLAYLLAH